MKEALKVKRIISDSEKLPYELLFLADESKEAIEDYVYRGEVYGGYLGDMLVGVYVLLRTRPFTIELVNLAVAEKYQGRGIGKLLVKHAIQMGKEKGCKVMELGTGNAGIGQLALYQKCGFSIVAVDYDFFRKHYEKPIFENGIECRHMIRLSMDLV